MFPPYYINLAEKKTQYRRNPTVLTHNALSSYNRYLMYESKILETFFLRCIDSLTDTFVLKGNFGVWPHYRSTLRTRMYGCQMPWVSALTQGQGISALVRAYVLIQNEEYLAIAESALESFKILSTEGGILSVDGDDHDWWYEEFACASGKPSGVLNGFIFALLGAHDFYLLTQDATAKHLFDKGISTLCHHLRDFEANHPFMLTFYDRYKHAASVKYHLLHVDLVKTLYAITKKELFREYYERWTKSYKEQYTSWPRKTLFKIHWILSGHDIRDCLGTLVNSIELPFRQNASEEPDNTT